MQLIVLILFALNCFIFLSILFYEFLYSLFNFLKFSHLESLFLPSALGVPGPVPSLGVHLGKVKGHKLPPVSRDSDGDGGGRSRRGGEEAGQG